MAVLLSASTLVRCECETNEFFPGATLTPDSVLSFGEVAVSTEKTLSIQVRSNGSAAYKITQAALKPGQNERSQWRVTPDPLLMIGLTPGKTTTISVTYRPCPEAWVGDQVNLEYNFDNCPTNPDAGDLEIVDNSREGNRQINLSGQPVAPPNVTVYCPASGGCNNPNPQLVECNGMSFGTVLSGETPCDLIIEVRNEWENGRPAGDLSVDRMEVLVKDFNIVTGAPILNGADLGFKILDEAGAPLLVDSQNPFVVASDPLAMEGKKRFKLSFTGERTGLWRGEAASMTGLRLYTSDPERPIVTAPLTAIGSAPNIEVFPSFVNFGSVPQGFTKTSTVRISNEGDANLRITEIRIGGGNPEFTIRSSNGNLTNIMLAQTEAVQVFISYTPSDTGTDLEKLVIASTDPVDPVLEVPLRGGAVPAIEVSPSASLVFPLPGGAPPFPPRNECLTIRNVGSGNLIVNQLQITGPASPAFPNGDPNHRSVDDFRITTPSNCGTLPCNPALNLCPPNLVGCAMSSAQVCIEYRNNDISSSDLAVLNISSNDPANPIYNLVLDASDVPCLFPTGAITVSTPRPCVGQPVMVSGASSSPGGPPGGSAIIVDYQWSFLFPPPPVPALNPNGTAMTSFTPTRGGVYFLGLQVTNDCGGVSQQQAQEMINVADNCN